MAITQGNTGSGGGVSSSVTVTSLPSTPAGSSTIGKVDQGVGGVSAWKVDGSAVVQPVSGTVAVSSLPTLPAGSNTIGKIDQGAGGASAWKVDGSAVVQPVSGSVSVSALPALPAGTNVIGQVQLSKAPALVSTANSSTTPLTGAAVFTGTSEDVSGYAAVVVNVIADQAGTLSPQFSSNGTNWDFAGSHAIAAGTGAMFVFRPGTQFFRLVYTNGGVAQSSFRLQTLYHPNDIDIATVQSLSAGMVNPTTQMMGANLLVQPTGGTTWSPASADSSARLVVAGAVANNAAPSYSEGASALLSTNLAGALRVTAPVQLPAALVNNRLDVNVGKVPGTVSTANSTTATLANAAVFTGTSEDVSGYSSVSVNVFADQSSAANGLSLQWSSNGTNWDILNTYTVTLNVGQTVLLPPRAQFFRVVYTNGGVTQTNFRLQTVYHQTQVSQDVGTSASQVQGTAAAGSALVGSPVQIGGSDGTNVQPVKVDSTGRLTIMGPTATGATLTGVQTFPISGQNNSGNVAVIGVANNNVDSVATGFNSAIVVGQQYDLNGGSWDRHRNNVDATLLASASRTTTQGPTTLTTYNLGAIIFVLDMTTVGTGSVTLTISEVDPASGKSILLLSGAAVTTNTTNVYTIDPMLTAAANSIAKVRTPRTLSWTVTANNANPATYSLGAMELMP